MRKISKHHASTLKTISILLLLFIKYIPFFSLVNAVPHGLGPGRFFNKNKINSNSNKNKNDDISKTAESTISEFLMKHHKQKEHKFYIQGWRWHTLSLIRDTSRLEKLALTLLQSSLLPPKASSTESDCTEKQQDAIDLATRHVIDFNMKGLHKVENELFFPWLKERLHSNNYDCNINNVEDEMEDSNDIEEALLYILNEIEKERDFVFKLGQTVKDQSRLAASNDITQSQRSEALSNIAQMSAVLNSRTRGIMDKEDSLLVPSISIMVPEKEQRNFNNRVIRKLGLLDSRLHLVGMYDAVWATNDSEEKRLFEEMIPYIPRKMIPRWKRNLYMPKAGILDSC